MGYVLGVDLGTTFTAAAVWREGTAQIASLGSRGTAIPSVVLLRDDETVLTGEAAERRAMTEPDRVAREFKRRLGDQTPILLAGTPYSAEALMSRLLRWVVEEVSTREGESPESIVVTHPANWGAYKIDLLNQAIRIADVGAPVTLISEPEAAAVAYASQQRLDVGQVVAVFDLGGGTFDAAVLRRTDTGFEILGEPEGIERLGGIDFDAAVFAHVARAVGDSLEQLDENDPTAQNAVARLRADCIEAKEALSSDTDTSIPVMLPNLQTEVRLTRSEFEAMIRPSLVDAIEALRRALRGAGVQPEDVAAVLLVGGSSRIPLVAQLVGAELARPVAVDAHPKHAIAIGAAFAAGSDLSRPDAASVVAPPSAAEPPPPGAPPPVVPPPPVAPPPTVAEPPPTEPVPTTPARETAAPPAAAAAGVAAAGVAAAGVAAAGTASAATPPPRGPAAGGPDLPEPPEEPPAAPGTPSDDGGGGNRLLIFGAIGAAVVLAVIFAVISLSGDDGGDVTAGDDTPDDTADDTPDDDETTTTSSTTSTTTSTTTTTTLPPDEDCTEAMTLDLWVCLDSIRLDGAEYVVGYTGEFGGEVLSVNSGMHLHVFGDTTDPADAGNSAPVPAGWQVIDTPDEFRIATDNSSLVPPVAKVCAVVADARPERVGTAHTYYDPANGNCIPVPT